MKYLNKRELTRLSTVVVMITVALGTAMLTGCKQKKQREDIIVRKAETPKPQAPIRMQDYSQVKDVEWLDRIYQVDIHRMANDSLKMVKDETGQKFVDNVFSLTVSRNDGSVFFSRSFTKAYFLNHITEDFRKNGILEGIVFDKAEGDWLMFAASVGLPQTDEYIPLIVKLSRMGDLVIVQDTQMDTNGAAGDAGQSDADDEDGV